MKVSMTQLKEYKSNVLKMYFFKFFTGLHFFSAVLVPFFTVWGGISFAQIMILQAIFTFSIFLFEIPTGTIADKFGRRKSLALGGLAGIIGVLVYTSYPNFWVFAVGEVLLALSTTLISGADSALIYDSLKKTHQEKESKKIFGRIETFGLIAIMVSGPIGSVIAYYLGLRMPLLLTSIPCAIFFIIALTLKEPPLRTKQEQKDYFQIMKEGVLYLKNHAILKVLAFDYISIQILSFFIIWVYQVILQKFSVSIGWFGFIFAGIVLGEIIVINNVHHLEQLVGSKKGYLFASAIISALAYFLVAFSPSVYLAIAGIVIIAAFGITRKVLFASYLNKFIKSKNRATVLSTVSMLLSFLAAIGNIFLGYAVDWNVTYTLIIIGSLMTLATLASRVEESHLID